MNTYCSPWENYDSVYISFNLTKSCRGHYYLACRVYKNRSNYTLEIFNASQDVIKIDDNINADSIEHALSLAEQQLKINNWIMIDKKHLIML